MRLHKHDELVETMARGLYKNHRYPNDDPFDLLDDTTKNEYRSDATAALDAMLEAAVRLGVATPERFRVSDEIDERSLILRMEAQTD